MKKYIPLLMVVCLTACNRYRHDGPPLVFFSMSEPSCETCVLYVDGAPQGRITKVFFDRYKSLEELHASEALAVTFEDGEYDLVIINEAGDTVSHEIYVFENGKNTLTQSVALKRKKPTATSSAGAYEKKSSNVITIDMSFRIQEGYKADGEWKYREKKF